MQDESSRSTGPMCISGTTSGQHTAPAPVISAPPAQKEGLTQSTSSAAGSPARTSPMRDNGWASMESAPASGVSSIDSFASFDPATSSWRMSQLSLFEGWTAYSGTWPRAGMTRNGTAFPRRPLAPLTDATESSWLPTPMATHYGSNRGGAAGRSAPPRLSLDAMASRGQWPTPLARDSRSFKGAKRGANSLGGEPLTVAVGGTLNPTWVEWLMGFPLGWTDLGA
jgi:hypothetical protein